MSAKLLMVTEYFYPSDTSGAYYLTKIAETLSKSTNFRVITTVSLNNKTELHSLKDNIYRINGTNLNKNKLITRIFRIIILSLKLTYKTLVVSKKGDYIITVTDPVLFTLLLPIIKKIKKIKYTIIVWDIFPENLLAAELIKEKSFFYKIVKYLFNKLYNSADSLIVIGRDMEDIVKKKVNNKSVSIKLIENWCNSNSVQPMFRIENKIIKKLELEEKIIFSFVGNLGRVNGLTNLLNASSFVKNKNFVLLFIGDGAMRSTIENHITLSPNSNVVYAGSFPASEQNEFLNACDIAVISLTSTMYGLGVPSKLYYNMSAGKPILFIGHEKSEVNQVINDHKIGWYHKPNDPRGLAQMFDTICTDHTIARKGEKSRKILEELYSEKYALQKYSNYFSSMIIK